MAKKKLKRGTKHGRGKGKWRIERRKHKKKDGSVSHYWNYRERIVRKSSSGKRKIRYRKGGKGRK